MSSKQSKTDDFKLEGARQKEVEFMRSVHVSVCSETMKNIISK